MAHSCCSRTYGPEQKALEWRKCTCPWEMRESKHELFLLHEELSEPDPQTVSLLKAFSLVYLESAISLSLSEKKGHSRETGSRFFFLNCSDACEDSSQAIRSSWWRRTPLSPSFLQNARPRRWETNSPTPAFRTQTFLVNVAYPCVFTLLKKLRKLPSKCHLHLFLCCVFRMSSSCIITKTGGHVCRLWFFHEVCCVAFAVVWTFLGHCFSLEARMATERLNQEQKLIGIKDITKERERERERVTHPRDRRKRDEKKRRKNCEGGGDVVVSFLSKRRETVLRDKNICSCIKTTLLSFWSSLCSR